MKVFKKINTKDYPIPNKLNIAILFIASFFTIAALYWTEQQSKWYLIGFGALFFSYVNNTLFSLLHEATHGHLNSDKKWNRWFGIYLAAFFPTSFSLQQLYHLGHHKRNRTDAEMFDLYYEGDKLWLKRLIIYGTVGGIYWITPFISCIMFLINPKWIFSPHIVESKFMSSLSASYMLKGLGKAKFKISTIRLEVIFTLFFQTSLFYFLNLSWQTWLICYWFFGIHWGSLQYADHVGSKRDIIHGAWNLKVSPLTRWIFLNYHIHLVHHRYPNLPWVYLKKLQDHSDPYPSYYSKLWEFVSGPRPATEKAPVFDQRFEAVIYDRTPLAKSLNKI